MSDSASLVSVDDDSYGGGVGSNVPWSHGSGSVCANDVVDCWSV